MSYFRFKLLTMKSLRLILVLSLFAFTGKLFSQGMPVSVIVSNADCAVNVSGTYVDSTTGNAGTFQLFAADPAGSSFMGTVSINALGSNYIITVCATDCNGVTNCATGPMVLGAVTTFNIDMGNGGGVTDNDGDGFNSFADCNDNDAAINPNATEVCDGADNNCDGTVDEGCNTGGCSLDILLVPDSLDNSPFVVYIYLAGLPAGGAIVWDFGDGGAATSMFPTWVYTNIGTYTVCATYADASGCTATDCVTFTVNADGSTTPGGINMQGFTLNVVGTMPSPNSVAEISSVNDFTIFPNPVSESATIQWNATSTEQGRLDIFNAQGQIVSTERYNVSAGAQQVQLNTQSLSAGMYIVRSVSNAGAVRQTTFVK
ncbi:MAG: hypothetical protein RL664_710 [Bacteroidota bacterium]|jgi:hypothetical protein